MRRELQFFHPFEAAKKGEVYCVMDNGNSICKIGMSQKAEERVKSVKNGNPLMKHVAVEVRDRYEAENYLHRRFHKRRVKGEWFKDVCFEEFKEAIDEYNEMKSHACLDTQLFYKFLYNTDCEYEKGTPIKVWEKLRRKQLNVLVLIDEYFNNKEVYIEKTNKILKNALKVNNVHFIYPYGQKSPCDLSVIEKNSLLPITKSFYFENYNQKTQSINLSILENTIDVLGYCYGLIVFWTKPSDLYNRIITCAKSKNINVRVVTAPHVVQVYKKKSHKKTYYKKAI